MTMNTPRVSIVMPTQNRATILPRAITSVLAQTFTDWELIIVDDSSTDETQQVIAQFAHRDARIRRLRLDERGGAPAARNLAIRKARGEYIAFLDDDDEWLPSKLRFQLDAFSCAPMATGVVHGSFLEVNAKGGELLRGDVRSSGGLALDALLRGNRLGQSTVMVRRSELESVAGFDEQLPRLQDWDLWIRLAMRTHFLGVSEPLARIHLTPGSISTDRAAIRSACLQLAAKYADENGLAKREYAELCYALGQMLIRHDLGSDGRTLVRCALRLHPWPPSRIAGGMLLLSGKQPYFTLAELYARLVGERPTHRSAAAAPGSGGNS